ncbi:MAG: hypothetical protein Q9227_002426 [Pyrenula ochraceoflavens]
MEDQAQYSGEVNDLWFRASHKEPSRTGVGKSVYTQDRVVSVLGCTEQHQLCNPAVLGSDGCSELTGLEVLGEYTYDMLQFNKRQSQIATRIWDIVDGQGVWGHLSDLGTQALIAETYVDGGNTQLSATLPEDQWIREVTGWYNGVLADIQRNIIDFAQGPMAPYDSHTYVEPPPANETWMCNSQKIRGTAYYNFSVVSLLTILIVGGVILLANQTVIPLVSLAQRLTGKGLSREQEWRQTYTLQLQRMAYEGAQIGRWQRTDKDVPVTVYGETFGPPSDGTITHGPPTSLKAPFFEQFTPDWESRWKVSHAKKEDSKTEEDWAYVGQWSVEEPTVLKGIEGDAGLVVKNAAAHHAISAKFPSKIDNKGKTLVVQYEVKLQTNARPPDGLECGGAYLKLLKDSKNLHAEEFSNASPYVIMFGPDKCGATNKVHFIFKHKNPKTGEYEEKHLKSPPMAKTVKTSSLYSLYVKPDQSFELLVDGTSMKNGSLLEDFTPSVNPEKEIDDPKDSKPDDWVDESRIPDPDAKKPDDWDEDAPFEIVDKDATKPDDWLEDEPTQIPDPEAEKPEDWDDEEDGDWVPPTVPNPKCEEVSGCGKWEPPMIKNPDYKGKWTAPYIDNPAYKGVWKPRKIPNPDFFEDKTPANFEPMGAIGFEIWTMQSDILFDNVYIGHSIEDAQKLKAETWDVKRPIEDAEEEATKPAAPEPPKSPSDLKFMDDPVTYVKEKVDLFITIAKRDPIEAIKFVPEVAGGAGVLLVTVIAILVGTFTAGGSAAPAAKDAAKKAGEKAAEAKEKTAEAVSTGAENVKAEVNKRTTRSSAAAEQ